MTVPSAPGTIGITVTYMYHSFFFQLSSKFYVIISLFSFFQFYAVVSRNGNVYYSSGCTTIHINFIPGLMSRVFANGQGDRGSIPGRVIPKTQKMVLDAALISTQHYKVRIERKVE